MLGIGAVFKNETHIMIEWIEHYLNHGVDFIYLINDKSTDNIDIIKQMYSQNYKIKFFDSDVDSGPYCRQIDIYYKYLSEEIPKYEWFGVLDLDEFLYSPKYHNLKDALKLVPESINQIFLNWVTYGSNNHIEQPISAVSGFKKRISDISNPNFLSHKNLFRPKFLVKLDIHTHTVMGDSGNFSYQKDPNDPLFLLNHYVIQSKKFFNTVKATRGDVNKIVDSSFRNDSYFNRYDHNDVTDDRLFIQNQEIIEKNYDIIKSFREKYVSF